jgi:hypothetical protein
LPPLVVILVRLQLHMSCRKSTIQIAPSNDRPPVVKEYFDWPPIRDPSENEQALFDDTGDGTRRKTGYDCLARDDRKRKYCEANDHRSAAYSKELV